MTITLDITGFYYSIEVDSSGANSVLDVLNRANGVRADNGGVLSFDLDSAGFVKKLTVAYDGGSDPKSRQNNSAFGLERPVGIYSYSDDVLNSANRIGNSGNVPGLLVWQYYVFDQNGRAKNESVITPPERVITSASEPFGLADGDRIVWRLVGIFGLNQFIDAAREEITTESKGQSLSLKAAAELFRKKMKPMNVR